MPEEDKNSRFKRYEARQKLKTDKEDVPKRKVIGWNMRDNKEIFADED